MEVGKSIVRVDAFDKVTGRTKYTDDLCDASAYVAKILHSTIAHGRVLSIDTTEAEKIEGVVKVVTCFDLGEYKNYFLFGPGVLTLSLSNLFTLALASS